MRESHDPKSLVQSGRSRDTTGFATDPAAMLMPRPAFSEMYSTTPEPRAIAFAWSMRSRSPVWRACDWMPSCPRRTNSPPFPVTADIAGHSGAIVANCIAPRTGASTNETLSASLRAPILPPRAASLRASVPTPPNTDVFQRSMPSSAPSANVRQKRAGMLE